MEPEDLPPGWTMLRDARWMDAGAWVRDDGFVVLVLERGHSVFEPKDGIPPEIRVEAWEDAVRELRRQEAHWIFFGLGAFERVELEPGRLERILARVDAEFPRRPPPLQLVRDD